MSLIENVSRRHFLGTTLSTGAFVLAAQVLPKSAFAQDPACAPAPRARALNPSVYLGIETDGTVYIITHRSEMGTGIRTTLPLVAADELDADWSAVRIEQGLGDTKYGDQNTDGSRSIRDFYDAFRRAGAGRALDARERRRGALAGAGVGDHRPEQHLIHARSNRRLAFASVVADAAKLPVPKDADLVFKPRSEWKFVGQERGIYDMRDIATGKAPFGPRHLPRGHGVRVDRAPAGRARLGEEPGRQRRAGGEGRAAGRHAAIRRSRR
jgi:isoquinoline 1-oxidoreductase beta subunit